MGQLENDVVDVATMSDRFRLFVAFESIEELFLQSNDVFGAVERRERRRRKRVDVAALAGLVETISPRDWDAVVGRSALAEECEHAEAAQRDEARVLSRNAGCVLWRGDVN